MLSTWDNRRRIKQQKKDHVFGSHSTLRSLISSVLTSLSLLLHNHYVTLISKQSGLWEGLWLLLTWSRIEATQNSTHSAPDAPLYTPSRDYHLSSSFHKSLPLAPLLRIMWQSSPVTMVTGPFLGNVIADLAFSLSFSLYLTLPSHFLTLSPPLFLSSPSLSICLPWQLLNYWFDEIFSCYPALLLMALVVALSQEVLKAQSGDHTSVDLLANTDSGHRGGHAHLALWPIECFLS